MNRHQTIEQMTYSSSFSDSVSQAAAVLAAAGVAGAARVRQAGPRSQELRGSTHAGDIPLVARRPGSGGPLQHAQAPAIPCPQR